MASLQTPERIRTLQRKLYLKAKAEPAFRFYLLYDKIHRADILSHAYALARSNGGAPGVDGVTFERIEADGLEEWLAGLREDLVAKTYRPAAVRRVMIPKPGGGERPLGIPTIRDRVVQTAAKLVLGPIFEADFEDSAYGYRPGRSGADAIKDVHRHICRGYTDVVDADLSGGGHPKQAMVLTPFSRMGPPPRSFAADAHDCIMVRSPLDRPNTRLWRDDPRPMAASPTADARLSPSNCARVSGQRSACV